MPATSPTASRNNLRQSEAFAERQVGLLQAEYGPGRIVRRSNGESDGEEGYAAWLESLVCGLLGHPCQQ